mmetsp:Transcript_8695/g.12296  ORF Transcript_8695/g.12296 Transcript_8695/m.12296 type:complete len:652 (-) Transcript_8695:413-2368(-)
MTRFFSRLRAKVALIIPRKDGRRRNKHNRSSESAASTVEEDQIPQESSPIPASILEEMEKMNVQVEEERRKSFTIMKEEASSGKPPSDNDPVPETDISTDEVVEDWDSGAQIQHASAEPMLGNKSNHTTASMLEEMERMNAQLEAEQKKVAKISASSVEADNKEKDDDEPIPDMSILEKIEQMNAQYELERQKSKASMNNVSIGSCMSDDNNDDHVQIMISEDSSLEPKAEEVMNTTAAESNNTVGGDQSPTSTEKTVEATVSELERMNAQLEADRRKSAMFHDMQHSMARLLNECDQVEEECSYDDNKSAASKGSAEKLQEIGPPQDSFSVESDESKLDKLPETIPSDALQVQQQRGQSLEKKDMLFPHEEVPDFSMEYDSDSDVDDSIHIRSLSQMDNKRSLPTIEGDDMITATKDEDTNGKDSIVFREASVPKCDLSSKKFDESTASFCAEVLFAEKIKEMKELHADAQKRINETDSSSVISATSNSMKDLSMKISEMERMNSMIETERRFTEQLLEVERMNEIVEAAQLAEFLEAMNSDLNEELIRNSLRQQALEATMQLIKEHFDQFVEENPSGSYEEWIEELHPENAQSRRHIVNGRNIDHRFYVEQSDHRKLWNNNLGDGARQFVDARTFNDSMHFSAEELSSL